MISQLTCPSCCHIWKTFLGTFEIVAQDSGALGNPVARWSFVICKQRVMLVTFKKLSEIDSRLITQMVQITIEKICPRGGILAKLREMFKRFRNEIWTRTLGSQSDIVIVEFSLPWIVRKISFLST